MGVIDEGSIGATDEEIDSKANMTNTCAGGRSSDRGETSKHNYVNHRLTHMRTGDGEAPKCKPVPLQRASRHA
jgi:hypothetical protein